MEVELKSTILAVQDLESSKRFYQDVFGWEIVIDIPVLVSFKMSDNHDLMLYKRESFAVNTHQMPELIPCDAISGTELYFHVNDIEGIIVRLEKAGERKLSGLAPRDWGDKTAYYADQDCNVLAVAVPIDAQ